MSERQPSVAYRKSPRVSFLEEKKEVNGRIVSRWQVVYSVLVQLNGGQTLGIVGRLFRGFSHFERILHLQVQHSLVDMRPQAEMAQLCNITGVKLITYGTVMGGLLSEKFLHVRDPSGMFGGPPLNTPSLNKYKRMVDAWGGWELFQELLRETHRVAQKHDVSIPIVAVKYILDQPAVAGSMVGVRLGLSEHIQENKKIFTLALDDDDRGRIKSVLRRSKDLMRVIGDCGAEYRRA